MTDHHWPKSYAPLIYSNIKEEMSHNIIKSPATVNNCLLEKEKLPLLEPVEALLQLC